MIRKLQFKLFLFFVRDDLQPKLGSFTVEDHLQSFLGIVLGYCTIQLTLVQAPLPPPPSLWGFLEFFRKTIKHQHLTFSVAVRLCLARILRQAYWWSVTMVTRYDVISSRWSNQFWVKMNVFSTFFNNKSKACVCKDAKCSFMCYLTRQAQKNTIYPGYTELHVLI